MTDKPTTAQLEQVYASHLSARPELDWLKPARQRAMEAFLARGFPTTRQEEWKYTDLSSMEARNNDYLARNPATHSDEEVGDLIAQVPDTSDGPFIVFVNGFFRADLSRLDARIAGLHITTLSEPDEHSKSTVDEYLGHLADVETSQLAALNGAFITDGLVIQIAEGASLPEPVTVVYASNARPISVQPRVLVRAGAHSRARIVEHYTGSGAGLTNAVTEIYCAPGANLGYLKLQAESATAYHAAAQQVHLEKDSRFDAIHLDLGAALARNDLNVRLAGPGAEATLHGLFFANGRQHIDNHTLVDHLAVNTKSTEDFRGIMDQRGRGVFNGKIMVRPGADGTDAQLSNRNLLLSPTAEVDTKPELEIYADDVKCSHGATTGQLDNDAMFYLRSRGVARETARQLLIAAFTHAITEQITDSDLRHHVENLLQQRLPASDTETDAK